MNKIEQLKFKYDTISGWIEKADSKAQILIGVQLFILGYVIEKKSSELHLSFINLILLTLFIVSSLISLYFLYLIIRPRLENKNFGSKIYFRDLAKTSEHEHSKVKNDLINESDEEYIEDIAGQILSISKVCNEKYEYLLEAERFLIGSFILGLLMYIFSLFKC